MNIKFLCELFEEYRRAYDKLSDQVSIEFELDGEALEFTQRLEHEDGVVFMFKRKG